MRRIILPAITLFCVAGTIILFLILVDTALPPNTSSEKRDRIESLYWSLSPRTLLSRLSLLPPMENVGPKRTVAAIIENHEVARIWHAGLEHALLVEEILVEGGISRFAVLFDLDDLPKEIGPLRSLRPYFVDGVHAYTDVLIHAGGSPEALERVSQEHGITGINALRYGGTEHFYRRPDVPAPHDLFLKTGSIALLLPESPPVPWPPYETGPALPGEPADTVSLLFFSALHDVTFTYDATERRYLRMNGGVQSPARPANIVVLEVPARVAGEYGRLEIPVQGSGAALLFRDGLARPITWEKRNAEGWTFVTDEGERVPLAKGQTWLVLLPQLQRVRWSQAAHQDDGF